MPNLLTFDGKDIKSIDFSPWGGIDGFLDATSSGGAGSLTALRQLVPWLQKGVTMTGNAVSQLPYEIENAAGDEIDEDMAWGAIHDPRKYIKLVADALCGGCAYLIVKKTSRALVSFQYVLPSTMTPNYNGAGELVYFTRQYGSKHFTLSLDEVVYFWLPDDTVEIGPALVTPLRNATLPAQLIAGMDSSLKQYSDRGFIPPTILAVKGMVNQSERERTEKWWNAFLRGWTKTAAKIVNSESVVPQVVGAGMDELRGTYSQITRQQIENIAASFDIPMSLFMSNAANYATANSDRKTWYETGTFVSIYQCIEDAFNEQLFKRWGWRFEFEPEKLPAFQTEEADKSSAVATLTNTLATNPQEFVITCDILGIELSDEQKAMIEALSGPVEVVDMPEPVEAMPIVDESTDEELADDTASALMAWRNFARKRAGKYKDFENKSIPPAILAQINIDAHAGRDIDEIYREAVRKSRKAKPDAEAALVLDGLKATIAAMKSNPQPPNINVTMSPISIKAEMPQPGAPEVIVNIPEQPTPIVNVTIPEQQAPVINITNPDQPAPVVNVTAIPGEVTVNMPTPKPVEVVRNNQGVVTEIRPKR